MNDAHVRHLRVPWRVPNRGVAAARVPAQEAALAERHACKDFESIGEVHLFRKQCDDLGPAILVDDSLRAEKACVRLTVFAVADRSRGASRRHEVAAKRAAATLKWMVHGASRDAGRPYKKVHACRILPNAVWLFSRDNAQAEFHDAPRRVNALGSPRASRFRRAPHQLRYR